MLAALTRLHDIAGIEAFVTGVTTAGVYEKAENAALLDALGLLPRQAGIASIERIVRATGATAFAPCADLLARAAAAAPEHAALLRHAAAALVGVLPAQPKPANDWQPRGPVVEPSFIVDLLGALTAIDEALADRAVTHVLSRPGTYDPDTGPGARHESASKRDESASWFRQCIARSRSAACRVPRAPAGAHRRTAHAARRLAPAERGRLQLPTLHGTRSLSQ